MQKSRVLFCGMRALQAEVSSHRHLGRPLLWDSPPDAGCCGLQVCKNVILAGINVTIMDHRPVIATDLTAQFYLNQEHLGKNVSEARHGSRR